MSEPHGISLKLSGSSCPQRSRVRSNSYFVEKIQGLEFTQTAFAVFFPLLLTR
jgi:hypothetical protein